MQRISQCTHVRPNACKHGLDCIVMSIHPYSIEVKDGGLDVTVDNADDALHSEVGRSHHRRAKLTGERRLDLL